MDNRYGSLGFLVMAPQSLSFSEPKKKLRKTNQNHMNNYGYIHYILYWLLLLSNLSFTISPSIFFYCFLLLFSEIKRRRKIEMKKEEEEKSANLISF